MMTIYDQQNIKSDGRLYDINSDPDVEPNCPKLDIEAPK